MSDDTSFDAMTPHSLRWFARGVAAATALTIGATVCVILAVPSPHRHDDRPEKAVNRARIIEREAFPRWAISHVDRTCPTSILELAPYIPSVFDPWGAPWAVSCPRSHVGLVVRSAGDDRTHGTYDDIIVGTPRPDPRPPTCGNNEKLELRLEPW